jgi:serine protease Do
VRARLIRITGVDLRLFDFDQDLTWAVFFLNADEKIYGRYGGRDARSAEARLSLPGLHYAMEAALASYRTGGGWIVERPGPPQRAEDLPAAKRLRGGECIHCHQVNEFRREALKASGQWRREDLWVYPLPENIGLTLDIDVGNRVRAVAAGAAGRAGLRPGDTVLMINACAVHSFADAQYALHRSPAVGRITITWQRGRETHSGDTELIAGWRKTNLTWRPSLLDILPSLPLFGTDLSAAEKKTLGLPERRLAFRQEDPVQREMRAAGVRVGDVVLGIDEQPLEMTMDDFLGNVRRNYLVGDRVTLQVLRDGRRVDVPLTLK